MSPPQIVVTGSDGMIGSHCRSFLTAQSITGTDLEIIPCNRQQFNDDSTLDAILQDADVVIHLAGMNRGDEEEVAAANIAIAERLTTALHRCGSRPHVIYSSSTHIDGPTRYGQSKRIAGEQLAAWAKAVNAPCCLLVLPHVFGEHGKPFYNSVVSTFAYQLVHGISPTIKHDGQLQLLHAQSVAQIIWDVIQNKTTGERRPQGTPLKVSELLTRLEKLQNRYAGGTIPNLDHPLDHQLFNTLRSYIPPADRPIDLTRHTDDRGYLFEAIRTDGQGQVFLSTTRPGITRGNHFHLKKVERFLVISGSAKIRLRKIDTQEVITYDVSGDTLQAIDIPTLHTHNITNVGDDILMTLFWSGDHFDPQNSDTYFLPVEPDPASHPSPSPTRS